MNRETIQAYRFQRKRSPKGNPPPAKVALINARAALLDNPKHAQHEDSTRISRAPCAPAGAPFQRGLRWVEAANRNGFRFVAYADELLGSIRHQGWYLDEDSQDEVARGAVYQVTGVEGGARYVAGIADPMGNDGAAAIDFSRVYLGEPAGYAQDARHDQGATEAAHAADECARIYAEKERDYNRESAARIRHDGLKEQIKALCVERRALLRAVRPPQQVAQALLDTATVAVDEIESKIRTALVERAQLRLDYDHTEGWKNAA